MIVMYAVSTNKKITRYILNKLCNHYMSTYNIAIALTPNS